MKTKRLCTIAWLLVFIVFAHTSHSGKGPDVSLPTDPVKDINILQSWQGDFPVSQLHSLPEGQHEMPLGYINNLKTFSMVWQALNPTEKTPAIDFTDNLVIFTRNTRFYNRISIFKITLKSGIAEVLAMETRSAMSITDKVAMSMAVVPKKGIKGLQSGDEVIPIP